MAEDIKVNIGSAFPLKEEKTFIVLGRNLVTGLPETIEMSSVEIREDIFGVEDIANGWNLYDQACILALAGDADGTVATLHRALATGWAHRRIFEDDDFDLLKGDPEFDEILEEVRSRL